MTGALGPSGGSRVQPAVRAPGSEPVEALREAIRWCVGAMRSLPPAEEASPGEIEAIRRGKEQIARGEYIRLGDLQRELGLPTE